MGRPTLTWLEDGEKGQIIYKNGRLFQKGPKFLEDRIAKE
jgi:hypothetical protein